MTAIDTDLADRWGAEARRHVLVHPEEHVVRFLARTRPDREANRGRRALEIGCGGGRNLLLLDRHGLSPVGIDISSDAIDVAAELLGATGVEADLRVTGYDRLVADGERFDVVLWDSPCLVPAARMAGQLAAVASLVADGGVLWTKFRHPDTWFSGLGDLEPDGTVRLDARAKEYAGMRYAFVTSGVAEGLVAGTGLGILDVERVELWKRRATERNVWTTVWAQRT
jgi:SAM-dependent methyltransferase